MFSVIDSNEIESKLDSSFDIVECDIVKHLYNFRIKGNEGEPAVSAFFSDGDSSTERLNENE